MELIFFIAEHLFASIKVSLIQLLILLGPGLFLAYLMDLIAGYIEIKAYRLMGRNLYLGLFDWLGTIVHELGHAMMCVIFGHSINEIVLFNPDPDSRTLGYVNHNWNKDSGYQSIGNFFIGIGPIIFGTVVLYFSAYFLLSESFFDPFLKVNLSHQTFQSLNSLLDLPVNISKAFGSFIKDAFTLNNLKRWEFYVFFYILFCVGSSIKLSKSDIQGALKGLSAIVSILIIINSVAKPLSGEFVSNKFIISIVKHYSVFFTLMTFVLFLNLSFLIILFILERIFKSRPMY
ncbi:M50 family metallopeptidase [Thermodesulfobacteriota bacterium]